MWEGDNLSRKYIPGQCNISGYREQMGSISGTPAGWIPGGGRTWCVGTQEVSMSSWIYE